VVAKCRNVVAKRHGSEFCGCELALNGGNRHDAVVGITEMSPGFIGLHLAGTLHQQACDDLEAVGDPVLDFLEKDGLLPDQIVFLPRLSPGECDVADRE